MRGRETERVRERERKGASERTGHYLRQLFLLRFTLGAEDLRSGPLWTLGKAWRRRARTHSKWKEASR